MSEKAYFEKKADDFWKQKDLLLKRHKAAALECGCREEDGKRAVHKPKKQKKTRYG